MTAINQDITLDQKRSYTFHYVFYSDTAKTTPLNVSTWVFYFTMKSKSTDTDLLAEVTKDTASFVVSGAGNNIVDMLLTEDDLDITEGSYVYDITVKNGSAVFTLQKGNFNIEYNVTDRV